MNKPVLHIVKIGGHVIDNKDLLNRFLTDLTEMRQTTLLVHGGGKIATDLAAKLGVSQQVIEGRRITDAETLKIATMVYAGLTNKHIVASLQALGLDAIGLSGADLNCIRAKKRAVKEIDYGFAGDLDTSSVNTGKFNALLKMQVIPVVCAITHDGQGQLLNTNADTIASALATALSPFYSVHLHYCFEKKGILLNPSDESSVIKTLQYSRYTSLKKEGIISSGMIPKLDNAFRALETGVTTVKVGSSEEIKNMLSNSDYHASQLSL
jgi:acetylglutamate kinase